MSSSEITFFTSYLNKASSYLEYGCGGSTFIAVNVPSISRIVSVEGNRKWIDKCMNNSVIRNAVERNILSFKHVEYGATDNYSRPSPTSDPATFPAYSEPPKGQFDLVLIDGRFRAACGLKLVNIVTETTHVLIHDYTNRPYYHVLEEFYDKIGVCETFACLKRKLNIDNNELARLISKYEYDSR